MLICIKSDETIEVIPQNSKDGQVKIKQIYQVLNFFFFFFLAFGFYRLFNFKKEVDFMQHYTVFWGQSPKLLILNLATIQQTSE